MVNNKGQAIVMLILIMTVALAIGLSIVQKSLVDVSTSSKVEQSSRAFSAAEAGIEKALQQEGANGSFTGTNNANSNFTTKLIPARSIDAGQSKQNALELLDLRKEDIGQVWLIDRDDTNNPPLIGYNQPTLDIYWGNFAATDKAALELTLVYYGVPAFGESGPATAIYRSHKWYLESDSNRILGNGFTLGTCGIGYKPNGTTAKYKCTYTITALPTGPTTYPILLRARLLYNITKQPFAVQTTASSCVTTACTLPPQETIIDSVGISGETQRKVNVTQTYNQVPSYFDYAIFSVGSITK